MSLSEKFREFTSVSYAEQAKAFLNAFWAEYGQTEGELIWGFANTFVTLDIERGKEGNDLDEFNTHRFLEKYGETRTIREMRDELRSIDIDFNKRIALIEYLLFRYHQTIEVFVSRPQGSQEEIDLAQAALDNAKHSLVVAQDALGASEMAAEDAKNKEEDAKNKAEEARIKEQEAKNRAQEAKNREDEANERAEEARQREEEAKKKEHKKQKIKN